MLYPNLCYNEVCNCYKGTAPYLFITLEKVCLISSRPLNIICILQVYMPVPTVVLNYFTVLRNMSITHLGQPSMTQLLQTASPKDMNQLQQLRYCMAIKVLYVIKVLCVN